VAPATATYVDETVGIAQPARTVRRPAPAARTARYERDVTTGSGARTVQRAAVRHTTVRRTTVRHTVATRSAPLVLDEAQRRVIYRTVIQRQIVPRAYLAYPAYPAYPTARTVVVPATTGTGYAVTAPPYEPYDVQDVQEVYDDDAPSVYASAALAPVIYPVGARLPANIALAPVPETLAVRVPAVRSYRSVLINNRVLLIDPVTYTVVADVTP
jgi:hypothetical protein